MTLAEAVPLCLVVVERILQRAEVRTLAIKGPAFATLGVRPERLSMDVDVLVDPAQRHLALETLRSAGWTDWAPESLYQPFEAHSKTLEHPLWPCSLDLHWTFPGFLALPETTFEALWEARACVEIAHQPVDTLCRPHALALETLHVLRDCPQDSEHQFVRGVLAAMPQELTSEETQALGDLLERTGASQTLAPLAELTGAKASASVSDNIRDPALESWRHRQRAAGVPMGWWFQTARERPLSALKTLATHSWLSDAQARTWAKASGIDYPGRWRVMRLRVFKGLTAVRIHVRRRLGD